MELNQVIKLNPDFDFSGYKLVSGTIFGEYKNYCLVKGNGNNFHKIWLNTDGVIIKKSLQYATLILKTSRNMEVITDQIKNEICKPIDNSKSIIEIWDVWYKRIKSINEKKKGLRRMLIRLNKFNRENGGIRHCNKVGYGHGEYLK